MEFFSKGLNIGFTLLSIMFKALYAKSSSLGICRTELVMKTRNKLPF